MLKHGNILAISLLVLTICGSAVAQIKPKSSKSVSNTDIASGLKEALTKGVGSAIKLLGKEDGFLANPRVKIPLPSSLRKLESGLRVAGQGKAVDEFTLLTKRRKYEKIRSAAQPTYCEKFSACCDNSI